ncbi:ABC transporter permease [Streptomyces shenzhenensis]|uniref:ABC transporter permease n=1 Tax=Streptomyces shenzhenensis TaxID=943815 RepID=UPI003696AC4E
MTTDVASKRAAEESQDSLSLMSHLARVQGMQILGLLVVICVIFSIVAPDAFLSGDNFRAVVINSSILVILGVGMTFVLITGGIDLSVGSVLVFSGVVAGKTMTALGGQGWLATAAGIVVAILCGLGWGLLNGILVAKARVPALIVTLGTFGAALGFSQIITGGIDLREIPDVLVNTIGVGNLFANVPVLSCIAGVVVIAGAILLHRTRFGLYTYAVGSNVEGCRRVGIKVDRQLIKVYALAGALSGLAGILNLAFYHSTTIGGQSATNLNVIAGVVIGGTSLFGGVGAVLGTVIGLFVPAVLQNGFVIVGIQPFWQQIVVGAVLIAAVFVDQRQRATAAGKRQHRQRENRRPTQHGATTSVR